MIPLKVSEIAKAVGGTLLCGNPDTEITSVACDSREVKNGTLFVPIRGEKVDAHKFIDDCMKICSATFTEYDAPEKPKSLTLRSKILLLHFRLLVHIIVQSLI